MYENDYMYAIERNSDYLAHYGIRGMKWGVRKAIESGNAKRLSRQYAKAQRKLAKLEKRANSGAKYARRAAALGAGAAAAGGLAALGTSGVGSALRKYSGVAGSVQGGVGRAMRTVGGAAARTGIPGVKNAGAYMMGAGRRIERSAGAATKAAYGAGRAVTRWGQRHSIGKAIGGDLAKAGNQIYGGSTKMVNFKGKLAPVKGGPLMPRQSNVLNTAGANARKINNNTYARVGAAALGAGLAAGAGYNAYRAATTKRAARKAAEFRSEMNKAFKGTKYANGGGNRQGKKRSRR